ncbi:MAG: hypothetical protein AB7V46_22640 [Thermomicrobiales bacterium]
MDIENLKAERDALREAIKKHRASQRPTERREQDHELYKLLGWEPEPPANCSDPTLNALLYRNTQHFDSAY